MIAEDSLANFQAEGGQQKKYLFNINEPGGKNINVVVDAQSTRLEHIFEACSRMSHMTVDSISWKKQKFFRAQDARKTIGSIFSAKMVEENKKEQFYKIDLNIQYKAIGGC